jgi:hypothetical protein
MKRYKIYTPYNSWYLVTEKGYVVEASNGLKKNENNDDIKTWQIVGGTSTHPFAGLRVIPMEVLAEMSSKELLYNNGNPRYTCVDIDHGTTRVHGNTKVHGIKRIDHIIC